jgi:hypothetical protein
MPLVACPGARTVLRRVLLVVGMLASLLPTMASAQHACTFQLGFKAIADQIPSLVGRCLEDEHANPQNGDALQKTSGGLLVWRKADNFTAFTDGYRSWVNGPVGLQQRLNTEVFDWEARAPVAPAPPAPTPTPRFVAAGLVRVDGVCYEAGKEPGGILQQFASRLGTRYTPTPRPCDRPIPQPGEIDAPPPPGFIADGLVMVDGQCYEEGKEPGGVAEGFARRLGAGYTPTPRDCAVPIRRPPPEPPQPRIQPFECYRSAGRVYCN